MRRIMKENIRRVYTYNKIESLLLIIPAGVFPLPTAYTTAQ
jgi:hypothetical protein